MASSGKLWQALASYGKLWQAPASSGKLKASLGQLYASFNAWYTSCGYHNWYTKYI
jgi:hypothetical protein